MELHGQTPNSINSGSYLIHDPKLDFSHLEENLATRLKSFQVEAIDFLNVAVLHQCREKSKRLSLESLNSCLRFSQNG
jgi:hypothetical protein